MSIQKEAEKPVFSMILSAFESFGLFYFKPGHKPVELLPCELDVRADFVQPVVFNATKPNEKWATDVTEFKIPETGKKLYLSAIFDQSGMIYPPYRK